MDNCHTFPATGIFAKHSYSGVHVKCLSRNCDSIPTTRLLGHSMFRTILVCPLTSPFNFTRAWEPQSLDSDKQTITGNWFHSSYLTTVSGKRAIGQVIVPVAPFLDLTVSSSDKCLLNVPVLGNAALEMQAFRLGLQKKSKRKKDILYLWFGASLIYINNCPTRCSTKQSICYSASSLYMFRVSTTPIIRSTQNCNYSLRYWSCFLCSYLPPTWPSLATLEGGRCTVPEAVVTVLCI